MIDLQKTIEEIEALASFGADPQCFKDAIKVMKMWRDMKNDSCEHELIRIIEEDYFPSIATQDFIVTIRGSCQRRDNAVQTIACVHGVKGVKMHDKDC